MRVAVSGLNCDVHIREYERLPHHVVRVERRQERDVHRDQAPNIERKTTLSRSVGECSLIC